MRTAAPPPTTSAPTPSSPRIDGHGSVSVSADEASRLSTRITVTVKPDTGYELDELTVTDAKNKRT